MRPQLAHRVPVPVIARFVQILRVLQSSSAAPVECWNMPTVHPPCQGRCEGKTPSSGHHASDKDHNIPCQDVHNIRCMYVAQLTVRICWMDACLACALISAYMHPGISRYSISQGSALNADDTHLKYSHTGFTPRPRLWLSTSRFSLLHPVISPGVGESQASTWDNAQTWS